MIITVTLNPVLDRTLSLPTLEVGSINRARFVRIDLGGKGINVSRALLRLGMKSLALGVFGGATGDFMRRGLEEMGLEVEAIPASGETRTNLTLYDESSRLQTKINEAGPPLGAKEIALLEEKAQALAEAGDIWVFSGNLPPGAPSELYARLIELVQRKGARAFLDTSGPALRLGVEARPYGVKPNVEEAAETMIQALSPSSDEDAFRAVEFFISLGAEIVALSRGRYGVVLGTKEGMVKAVPPAVEVKTVVGVGDSLLAGLIWALERGLSLKEMARYAVAAGTAAAMEEGTGTCTKEAVQKLAGQVRVYFLNSTLMNTSENPC